jgi:putative transposase
MVLPGLPGYIPRAKRSYRSARKKGAMVGRSERQASLTLAQFDVFFRTWVLETYHHHQQRRLKGTPLDRWQQGTWLPRLPESQAQ